LAHFSKKEQRKALLFEKRSKNFLVIAGTFLFGCRFCFASASCAPPVCARVAGGGLASEGAVNPRAVRKRTAVVEKWCE